MIDLFDFPTLLRSPLPPKKLCGKGRPFWFPASEKTKETEQKSPCGNRALPHSKYAKHEKNIPAESPSFTHRSWHHQCANRLLCCCTQSLLQKPTEVSAALGMSCGLKLGWQARRRLALAMQLNLSVFRLPASPLFYFPRFFFLAKFNHSIIEWDSYTWLQEFISLKSSYFVGKMLHKKNPNIFVSSNIKERFKTTIFLHPLFFSKFFHKLCKKSKGNTECLGCELFLRVLFWGIIFENFFLAL